MQKVWNTIGGIFLFPFIAAAVVVMLLFTCSLGVFASKGLGDSEAGDYVVGFAEESAAITRDDSLAFWGRVRTAWSAGWERNHPTEEGGAEAITTPVVQPSTTTVPVLQPIRSSIQSEAALAAWKNGDIGTTRRMYDRALSANAGDMLAVWLRDFDVVNCNAYDVMNDTSPNSAESIGRIKAAVEEVVTLCNPRITEAYFRFRIAQIFLATDQDGNLLDTEVLAGMDVNLLGKEGAARRIAPHDKVSVAFASLSDENYHIPGVYISAQQVDALIGKGTWLGDFNEWTFDPDKRYTIPGPPIVPENPPEPVVPTEAQLAVPEAPTPTEAPAAEIGPLGAAPPSETGGGGNTYTVQPGDWLYKIAREQNTTPDAIIAANPGIDPDNLIPGQVLSLP